MTLFSDLIAVVEIVVAVWFVFGVQWDITKSSTYTNDEYIIFRDIMVMLLLGFGYLMTFLSKYGLGAVGFTMLLTVVAIQLNLVIEPLLDGRITFGSPLLLNVASFIDGEFSAATLLISYGAIIGRASPTQLVIMAIAQAFAYAFNKVLIVFGLFAAEDVGGTLTIHMFGAYFGLAVSKVLGPPKASSLSNAVPTAVSDLLSLIGTTLLWVYWPSFVGATETAVPANEQFCVVHTIMALIGSTGATFYVSHKLKHGKLDAVHIANSTLAGGVAVGASARLNMTPAGALIGGMVVGAVSVYGYCHVSAFLEEKLGVYDTCGVHNLHGMPSVIGGLKSILFVTLNPNAEFLNHSVGIQALMQLFAVIGTVVFAITTGTITGRLMVQFAPVDKPEYTDATWWEGEYFEEEGEEEHNNGTKTVETYPSETTPLTA